MDYLLDAYFFKYLPFEVSPSTKKTIGVKAITIVMMADWVLRVQDPRKIIAENVSLFAAEIIFPFLCLLTFIHAFRHGARYIYTWIGILILGLCLENVRLLDPKLDVFWHSPGVSVLFGMRTPVYVIFGMYHMLLYPAYVMTRRLRLDWWAEGPACGIAVLLIDFPIHLIGVKFLWWTWHDDEPHLRERLYSSPWMMFALDAFIGSSFIWVLHFLRRLVLPYTYDRSLFLREFSCALLAAVFGLLLAIFQLKLFVYIPHDLLKINMGVLVSFSIAVYILIVITADRNNLREDARPKEGEKRFWFDELACALCIHFLFLMTLTLVGQPGEIVSEGLHQPIGPCGIIEKIENLQRQKYFCMERYRAKHFDFRCVPKLPHQIDDETPLEWYRICGKDFANRFEYMFIIWGFSFISLFLFYQIGARSGVTPVDLVKLPMKRTHKSGTDSTLPQHRDFEEQDSIDLSSLESFSEAEACAEESSNRNVSIKELLIDEANEVDKEEERLDSHGTKRTRSSSRSKLHSTGSIDKSGSLLPTPTRQLRSRKTVK